MTDIFQEVDEEVRREQLKKLWERYGNYLIAALRSRRRRRRRLARLSSGGKPSRRRNPAPPSNRPSTLAEAGKHQEAEAAFAKLATDGTAGYRVLARLREAAELARDRPARPRSPPTTRSPPTRVPDRSSRIWRPCAPAFCSSTARPIPKFATRLEPLTAADRTFRHSAREILALSAWKAGDMAAARQWTDMIMTDPQTPAGTRSRAEVLSELIAASGKG